MLISDYCRSEISEIKLKDSLGLFVFFPVSLVYLLGVSAPPSGHWGHHNLFTSREHETWPLWYENCISGYGNCIWVCKYRERDANKPALCWLTKEQQSECSGLDVMWPSPPGWRQMHVRKKKQSKDTVLGNRVQLIIKNKQKTKINK